jgi:hypothetical protein
MCPHEELPIWPQPGQVRMAARVALNDRARIRLAVKVAPGSADQQRFGADAYKAMLGNCMSGVYQMIGKLNPPVYILRV